MMSKRMHSPAIAVVMFVATLTLATTTAGNSSASSRVTVPEEARGMKEGLPSKFCLNLLANVFFLQFIQVYYSHFRSSFLT